VQAEFDSHEHCKRDCTVEYEKIEGITDHITAFVVHEISQSFVSSIT
jgi:hypothetical protein